MKNPAHPRSCQSFTLVELITAMAVLALLLVLLFSMINSAAKLTDSAEKKGDSAIQAEQVLDRIGLDIAGMVNRPDVDQFYYQPGVNTGNDKMFFYSQALGYSTAANASTNSVSLIGYRVENNSNLNPAQPVLQRLGLGLPLAAVSTVPSMQFLAFSTSAQTIPITYTSATGSSTISGSTSPFVTMVGTTGDADNGSSPKYYDEMSNEVFRMEICFQDQSGHFTSNPPCTNSSPSATTITNSASAIVVAVAVLDSKSRQLIPSSTAWTSLQQALPNLPSTITVSSPSSQPVLMDSLWNAALTDPTVIQNLKSNGIPTSVVAHVRIYQRYYPLIPPAAH